VGVGQHTGEGDWRNFLLDTRLEPPPEHHLHLLRSRQRVGAGSASYIALSVRRGQRPPNWGLLRRCDAARRWRRCRWTPGWSMGSCWRCLGSNRGWIAGTTPSRCLLLRARPVSGPRNRRRGCGLRSGGGGSPGEQTMG
jgi:hypothetical protein